MQIIYRAANLIDAHLVKGSLEQEGIHAFVSGEYLTGGVGQLPAADLVTVMVANHDVERARSIALEVDAALRDGTLALADSDDAPWSMQPVSD